MRVVACAASIAALLLSLSGPAAACYGGNCYGGYQGGFYPVGGVVQAAPPVVQTAPVYQAPVVQAPPIIQQPIVQAPPVYQAPVVQAAPVYQAPVVQTPPVVINVAPQGGCGDGYGCGQKYYRSYNGNYGPGYGNYGSGYSNYGTGYGNYGRTVYYERGPEYLVSYNEYPSYGYGSRSSYDGGYYEPRYYEPPYYKPYYRPYYRPVICSGGAFETGQAFCGQRP